MRTIYITEEQENRIYTEEKKKNIPSAQQQVHNKVNSGIMDIVTCGGMCEAKDKKYNFKKDIQSIAEFMKKEGLKVFPFPKVKLNWENQDGLFIRTGYYAPEDKTVVVFCKDRHPKDILRTFAHEMIHHMQNLRGDNLNFTSNDDVKDNKKLEKIEGEAYLKGNIYFRKWTEHENSKEMLNESIEEDIEPNEVDLSSFNIKKHLNPLFWKDEKLDSRIRIKLLDIADDFIKFLGIDWVKPEDITITGSLANYNWNKSYSDIDLHIIIDYTKVDKRTEFVKQYFYSQKTLWNKEHDGIKIFGFPVEVYVQDSNEPHASTGVYSIEKNEWVKEPEREKLSTSKVNKEYIKDKVAEFANKIDDLYSEYKKSGNDEYKIRKISEKAEKIFSEIKDERSKGLKGKSEISNGNIIFKCLRRMQYIDKIYELMINTYDKMNSIK